MENPIPQDLFSPAIFASQDNERGSSPPAAPPVTCADERRDKEVAERQLVRLREYLEEALADPQSEVAPLGITTYHLTRMLIRLGESIDKVLEECPTEPDQYAVLLEGIEVSMRVARQIGQFTRLRHLLSEAHQSLLTLQEG